ncbi:DUF4126 domain-containing protein [Faucicola boevrei]|uniref:DUF4126 domain-containing protein n=1 Tax=Faucicola boevrei TaxID=346665 RepID=UPI000366370E|nr:DUF4126 domain-containing protein [Moraxella boevrei]
MTAEIFLSVFLGIGLAASSGFRVFVPLFELSCASYFGIIPLNETWMWVGSVPALVILGVASIVESVSYLVPVPVLDNLLDTIAVPLAGVAGTLAIVAGGGAATIKGTSATTRAVSTATTGGLVNPAISMAETGTAIGLSVLSIFAPIIAMVALVIGLIGFIWLITKLRKSNNIR